MKRVRIFILAPDLAFHFRKSDKAQGEQFHTWELEGGIYRTDYFESIQEPMHQVV